VFGVNDAKVESHQRYAAKLELPFALISDRNKEIAAQFGFIKEDTGGIARGAVIIDKQGVVRYRKAGMPKTDELLGVLDTLRS
jgi:peroxiredoxin Q/BCP